MMARVSPLALSALLALVDVSTAQYPGMPRSSDPFAPQPNPYGPRPDVGRPGHRPGLHNPTSARTDLRLNGFQPSRRKDEDDNRGWVRNAVEAGKPAAERMFDGGSNPPK